ncbi:uncharacterized protein F4807DRAFT_26387 [Annulohypoxylon truncatum]|uniref:uncharacterized protein n=1 Tax=Annulohypoxylon truncatum TaxID=327061 RepID=UPI002008C5C9|nr:uncharacterized protein F4807DRAFT_26387 [Annulohypoxylon truncatum]KAI1211135.1 hypothetical protein F4807DRAFT_26387 [Annulohypoxylon truncatum]
MPVEIVTIVNSSGKIISNGKHLFNVLKEAKATYQEKKAALKAERAVKRSETFDVPPSPRYYDEVEYGDWPRRASHDDGASQATSRRSYGSRRSKQRAASQTRSALTERNLQTHSEVSSTAPSRPPPVTYRSPYAETAGREMTLSRPTLAHAPTMPAYADEPSIAPSMHTVTVPRSVSDPALREKRKEIDMDLAYGNVPPDLEERVDLDPAYKAAQKERNALDLIEKIEKLLTEAQCLHHTATHIIQHLQGNPDAAAAVALTLAELSALLGKMSPSFLSVLKGGSPAIFALLASPQFLIAAGVTVGVTVVMFGGWKIVKRVSEAESMAATPMAFPAYQPGPAEAERHHYPESEISAGFDEALVLEEELSTIESWRRGIVPFGEDEQADLELISPEADRAIRKQNGDDTRSIRTSKTSRTAKTNKTSKTSKTSKTHKSRRDSAGDSRSEKGADNASEAGSHRSHRSTQSHRSHRTDTTERTTKSKRPGKVEIKAIDDGRSDRDNSINVVLRPKKDNMLKSLFKKKKDREEKERVYSVVR